MRLELTRRGDYGVRAVLALADNDARELDGAGPTWLSVRQIAERMAIPPRILPSVMRRLAQAGLVTAREGRTGGHALSRSPQSISLLEIIEAIEGASRLRTCVLRDAPCAARGDCPVHASFANAHQSLRAELDRPGIPPLDRLASARSSPSSDRTKGVQDVTIART